MFSMLLYFKYYEQLHSKDNLSTLKSYFLEQLWTSGFWSPVISIKKSIVTVADCRQPLTVVRKSSVLDLAWFLDLALSANNSPVQFFKGFMLMFILLRKNYVFDSSERCIKFMLWKIMLFRDCWGFLCEAVLLYSMLSIWYLQITFLISCLAQWRKRR